jgi:chromosomal replication initiator protein
MISYTTNVTLPTVAYDIACGPFSLGVNPRVEIRRGPPSIRHIQETVADYYGLSQIDMVSQRRPREVAWPRQMAMYLCRELTIHSLTSIGRHFGNRDHTTILHGIRAVERRAGEYWQAREVLDLLREKLAA